MNANLEKCARCGGRLVAGLCTECDAVSATTTTVSNPLVDVIKKFIRLPEKSKVKLAPGSYELINRTTDERHPLNEPVVQIGRDQPNQIVISNDGAVSRNHAWVLYIDGAYWVQDLGSTNGTYVNGKKISSRRQLVAGDTIFIGKTEFLVRTPPGSNTFDTGNYQIVSEIGRGGMGHVYQAIDQRNRRMVAIKRLNLDNVEPERVASRKARFKREAMLAAKLKHPNIVSVYEAQLDSDNPYFVMELVSGITLRQQVNSRGGRLRADEYLPILKQLAQALHYAHKMKVTHRDVKPENIFIQADGIVKLSDFGIAHIADLETGNITKSGAMLGTIRYVSPEQMNNAKKVDHRSDIFSLGVVCYEALSGRVPFEGEGIIDMVAKIASSNEIPLNSVVTEINAQTAAVISKALEKNPGDRYQSALQFAQAFEDSLTPTNESG